jgi:hypothetical protein
MVSAARRIMVSTTRLSKCAFKGLKTRVVKRTWNHPWLTSATLAKEELVLNHSSLKLQSLVSHACEILARVEVILDLVAEGL